MLRGQGVGFAGLQGQGLVLGFSTWVKSLPEGPSEGPVCSGLGI